ncbi:MAG TPA: PadR family transcriptional regulator [Bryobacteraceae bacterium]|jgi:DNA-binding PadR family transcriptional regulator|nr:PadR family transcriptional regulator [Bryobacteraceae bacterium]
MNARAGTPELEGFLPLGQAALYILLALAGEERHGYGIMLEAARQSRGKYKPGPGTLYDNLRKLIDQGMIEESRRASPTEDPRRRYYRITAFGRRVLAADVERLEAVVREAKARLRPPSARTI